MHLQKCKVSAANRRHFLGVRGNQQQEVLAHCCALSDDGDNISILVLNARLLPVRELEQVNSRSVSSTPPITSQAVFTVDALQALPVPASLLELCSTSSTEPVLLRGVDRRQLAAVGFVEPVLRDISLTGLLVRIPFPDMPVPVEVLLGQSLSIDMSDSPAAERILVTATPANGLSQQLMALIPPFVPVSVAQQAYDASQIASIAASHSQSAEQSSQDSQQAASTTVAPSAAEPALSSSAMLSPFHRLVPSSIPAPSSLSLPVISEPTPPADQQQLLLAAVPAASAALPAASVPLASAPVPSAPRVLHWAMDAVAPPAPAHPGPAPFLPPPPMPPSVPGGFFSPQVPMAPAAPGPLAPPAFARGNPVAASLESADLSLLCMASSLFSRCTPADLVDLSSLDALVAMLAPEGSPPPRHAMTPPASPQARLEYIDDRLTALTTRAPLPPRPLPGWPGVFAASRALCRSVPPAVPVSTSAAPAAAQDLDSSYGRVADRHLFAQQQHPQSGAAADIDATRAAALRSASSVIDSEGSQPMGQRPVGEAAQALVSMPVDSLHGVQSLGSRLASLDPAAQILESADGLFYNATSSAHMAATARSLTSASTAFYDAARDHLKSFVAREHTVLPPARATELSRVVRDVFRGRPLLVNELRLAGSGDSTLFAVLRSQGELRVVVPAAQQLLAAMSFIVRLFSSVGDLPVNVFETASIEVSRLVHVERMAPDLVADFLESRLRVLEENFRRFHNGSLLLRPMYSPDLLLSVAARSELDALVRQRVQALTSQPAASADIERQIQAAIDARVASLGVPQAQAPAPAAPSARAAKRLAAKQRKAAAAVSAAAPAVAQAAPAPAVAAVPATAPAPAAALLPAVNPTPIVGGAHVGPASTAVMTAFSVANLNAAAAQRCFNFFKRGVCRSGSTCRFAHD